MIYIIVTTCINNKVGVKNLENREKRYTDCINSLLRIIKDVPDLKPIIVENNGNTDTFLNVFDCDVIYTSNNKLNFPNKGMNELLDIKEVINKYNIEDEDFVIKLTGRYKVLDLNFINLVKRLSGRFDALVKFFNVCTLKFHPNRDDCVLGHFAVKCKYLKKFQYGSNGNVSGESDFAMFIRDNVKDIFEIRNLSLECCFADNLRIINV